MGRGLGGGVARERVPGAREVGGRGGGGKTRSGSPPATPIAPDGSFSVDITTGGHDERASEIVAFLIRSEYYPPSLRGDPDLPEELLESALSRVAVTRTP